MTGTPHKLGRVTLLMTLKPQLPAQSVREDMEMNFWHGAEQRPQAEVGRVTSFLVLTKI